MLRVTGQALETFRDVLNWIIVQFRVGNNEGAGKINGPDIDLWVGPAGNSNLRKSGRDFDTQYANAYQNTHEIIPTGCIYIFVLSICMRPT